MSMAEAWLRERNVPEERWIGLKFRHSENTPGERWGSVVIDIERRGTEWIVTRLDRNSDVVSPDSSGLSAI
jgi:hypothetical protein